MTTAPLRVPHTPSKAAPVREPIQFPAAPVPEPIRVQSARRQPRDNSFLSALIDCTQEQSLTEHDAPVRVIPDFDEQRRSEDEAKIRHGLAEERKRRDAERQQRVGALAQQRRDAEERQRQAQVLDEQRRREAEERARLEAEEQARWEALAQQRRGAEAQARDAAEEQRQRDEEEQALREAEDLQRRFQQELDRLAMELSRREEAEKASQKAQEQARREAEEQARLATEERARLQAEELRAQEEVKAEREAEERFRAAMERVRQAAEERHLREAEPPEQDQVHDDEFVLAAEEEKNQVGPEAEEMEMEHIPAASVLFKHSVPPPSGFLKRAWSWMNRKYVPTKQLRVAETISLGEKRFVAVVQVDGRKFLIGGGTSGVALLTQLEDAVSPVAGSNPNGGLG